MKGKTQYFVYLLRLQNGALYTGIARDVGVRYRKHLNGGGGRYTRSFPPVGIAGCWEVSGGRGGAMSVEAFIKRRSRPDKERLLAEPKLLCREYRRLGGRSLEIVPADPSREGGQRTEGPA